jgi:PAS domain S-box-containing protein
VKTPPGGDLEGAIAGVSFPAYVIDSDGVIRWINDAAREIVGDVEGQDFTSLVVPEDRRRAAEFFAKKIAGTAAATDGVFTVVGRNDARADVEVSSVPLRRGDQVIGVFGLVAHRAPKAALPVHPALTPRQVEVLQLLERGCSTRQIAAQLHLSTETVRNHIRGVFRALDVHSRLEAVAIARREDLTGELAKA